jgi:hypothetical protein
MVRLVNAFDLNSEEYRGQVFPTARDPSPELIEINGTPKENRNRNRSIEVI